MKQKKILCFSILLWGMALEASLPAAQPVDIGSRRELMIDHTLIESFSGEARLRLHHPIRREIALEHNKPWEGNGTGYHTVFYDPYLEIYRMFYKAWQIPGADLPSHPLVIAYAESRDGIVWEKPSLGLHEYHGSTDNNIILKSINGEEPHDFSVFIDTNPNTRADRRYKAVGFQRNPRGLAVFYSDDGIRWKPYQNEPVLTGFAFDTQNTAFWDPEIKKYRLYIRHFHENPRRRGIMTAISDDFIHWSEPEWLSYPGAPDIELYTNQVKPYYRAPHLYIGFPAHYIDRGWTRSTTLLPEPGRRKRRAGFEVNTEGSVERFGTAVTESLIMTSRDGKTFTRWNQAFLRPGLRTRHNWSYGDNYIAWQVVETDSTFEDMPRVLSLYATESYFTDLDARLRRYMLRIDGFASAFAPRGGGSLLTVPLLFDGNQLRINFSTAAGGEMRVAIQDASGKPYPGFSARDCDVIFGDSLERIVTWNGNSDVSSLAGKPIRLKVILKDADLYSFTFSNRN